MKNFATYLQKNSNAKINMVLIFALLFSMCVGCNLNSEESSDKDNTTAERTKDESSKDNSTDESKDDSTDDSKEDSDDNEPVEKADASKSEIPSEEELQEMVKADILMFDQALKSKDFSNFYDDISDVWQEQTTVGKLKENFQKFIDGNSDLSGVKDLKATFTSEPRIDKSKRLDVLEVNGKYDTEPRDSTFELKYVPDGKEWKLISFYVQTTVYNTQ